MPASPLARKKSVAYGAGAPDTLSSDRRGTLRLFKVG